MYEAMRNRGLSDRTKAVLKKLASTGGRQAWDSPAHYERDAATVALSEPYERRDFALAYCKRRGIEETPSMRAKLEALLDEYATTRRSRKPSEIAAWLDAELAPSAARRMLTPGRPRSGPRRRYML